MLKRLKIIGLVALMSLPAFSWSDVTIKVTDLNGKPVTNAVVFLKSPTILAQTKPLERVEIAQQNRAFVPGVQIVTVGTAIDFPNRDDVRHHVYSFSLAKIFELKLYAGKPEDPVKFESVGVVELGCNIHDSMLGWVLVNDTSVFAKTDDAGYVSFKDQNEGQYKVDVWHRDFPYGAPYESFQLDNQTIQEHVLSLKTEGVTL
ncbi:methylamine utilization protein [Marinomonas atlantica]|uniref:methylamine utilization protein n=1 Tax=Marinomonas atlantica TaxID=1806668 RepID=UPI00082CFCB5|nr:methylamine utilization protein [Marinomonas atlantica]